VTAKSRSLCLDCVWLVMGLQQRCGTAVHTNVDVKIMTARGHWSVHVFTDMPKCYPCMAMQLATRSIPLR
jgi:hypothetical protein